MLWNSASMVGLFIKHLTTAFVPNKPVDHKLRNLRWAILRDIERILKISDISHETGESHIVSMGSIVENMIYTCVVSTESDKQDGGSCC